ncbi:hypothetical protein HZF24_00980 [Sedimentibacter hydroxybenzoicus DSM 7310]|uniref:Uncharacterized protein n=2 Tax=Sedimentibacter hydroxybenzoicus TaxID=29345 RepID=A0A974BH19_SEDHY|nr:hypothetical protein [Sedimentibacter hydroxybenzoicus DSM 7310]
MQNGFVTVHSEIKEIKSDMNDISSKMQNGFDEVHSEIKVIKSDMNDISGKMQNGFDEVHSEIKVIKSDMNDISGKMQNGFDEVHSEITIMKSDIKDVKMTLENETNKNIRIIAEGHRDLNNKLDNALKIENEKELLLIRLTILENEVNRIKARLDEIA